MSLTTTTTTTLDGGTQQKMMHMKTGTMTTIAMMTHSHGRSEVTSMIASIILLYTRDHPIHNYTTSTPHRLLSPLVKLSGQIVKWKEGERCGERGNASL